MSNTKTETILIRVTSEQKELIAKQADQHGLTLSDYMRMVSLSNNPSLLRQPDPETELTIFSIIPIRDQTLREAIYKTHKGKCFYTCEYFAFDDLFIDHIFPESCGGYNYIANYVPTTHRINTLKTNRIENALTERMLFINQLIFAPKVLDEYKSIMRFPIDAEYWELKKYLKRFYPEYLADFNYLSYKLRCNKKSGIPFQLIKKHSQSKNKVLYKKTDLDNFFTQYPNIR